MSPLDRFPRDWRASRDVDDRAGDESSQVEAAVESVGEGAEVVGAVFAEFERVEDSGKCGLQVAEHGVDPFDVREVARLAGADDAGHVQAAGVGRGGEAAEPVAMTQAPGTRLALAHLPIASDVKPLTSASFR